MTCWSNTEFLQQNDRLREISGFKADSCLLIFHFPYRMTFSQAVTFPWRLWFICCHNLPSDERQSGGKLESCNPMMLCNEVIIAIIPESHSGLKTTATTRSWVSLIRFNPQFKLLGFHRKLNYDFYDCVE